VDVADDSPLHSYQTLFSSGPNRWSKLGSSRTVARLAG
jgi:hypothetical protein